MKELSQDNNLSQTLIFPLKLDLNSEEIRLLKSLKKSLIHLGFNFNKFNKNEIEVSAIHPVFLEDQIDEIFRELIPVRSVSLSNISFK